MMQILANLHWAHPWAWGIASGPLWLAAWRRWRPGSEARAALAYADAAMRPWAVRSSQAPGGSLHWLFEVLLWLCVAATLAGPRQLLSLDPGGAARLEHRVNVMVVLEATPDAAAVDATGLSQLARARIALQDLQGRMRGERLGLLEYARGAGLFLPCTSDMALFNDDLNRAGPALLGDESGPGLPGALALAREELGREPGRSRAVLLVAAAGASADGTAPGALDRQIAALEYTGTPVDVLWMGGSAPDAGVAKLAAETGGKVASADKPGAWSTLYDDGIARMAANPPQASASFAWRELYAIPLLGAMLMLLILESAWTPRRRAAPMLLLAIGGLTALHPPEALAAESAMQRWQAWIAWSHGHYAQARQIYAQLPDYAGRMGEGDCDYRIKAYPQALAAFRGAVLLARSDRDRALALFNLGNTAFHIEGRLGEALDAYQASLTLLPGRAATVRNLDLARAQWAEEHPEQEIVGILKRRAATNVTHFGDTSNLTPSELGRQPKSARPVAEQGQALTAGGKLSAQAASAPQAGAAAMTLTAADVQAARRGLPLLHDDSTELLGGLFDHDSHEAASAVGSAP